jgi:hypothetical protein
MPSRGCRALRRHAGRHANEHLLSQFSHTIGNQMMKLMPHHVNAAEATRLGVISGWYGTKVSGTFVTGPFPTEEGCLESITAVGPISQDQRI